MVRVIAGEFKSRRLKTLPGIATRPTSDRLKEALFNLLQTRITGSRFLDCFAGSGSIGIEALSRGAGFAVFVESLPSAVKVIRQNLQALGLEPFSQYDVVGQPVESGLRILGRAGKKFDIVFLDPPYAGIELYPQVLGLLQSQQLLAPEGIVIAEHSKFFELPGETLQLVKLREVRQGDSILSLFQGPA